MPDQPPQTAAPPPPLLPLVKNGGVAEDVPCDRCTYSLKALPCDGVCPECGWSIVRTLRGSVLANSSPRYLHTIRTGAQWLRFGAGIVALIWCGFALFAILYAAVGEDAFKGAAAQGSLWLLLISLAVGIGSLCVGWRTLAAPDPDLHPASLNQVYRRPTRRLSSAIGLLGVCAFGSGILGNAIDPTGLAGECLLLTLVASIVGLAALIPVCWFFSISYFRTLARRLADPELDTHAHRLRVFVFTSLIAIVVGYLVLGLIIAAPEWTHGFVILLPLSAAAMFAVLALCAARYASLARAFIGSTAALRDASS